MIGLRGNHVTFRTGFSVPGPVISHSPPRRLFPADDIRRGCWGGRFLRLAGLVASLAWNPDREISTR